MPKIQLPPEIRARFEKAGSRKSKTRINLPPEIREKFRQAGARGGKARARNLSPAEISEIGFAGMKARFGEDVRRRKVQAA